MRVCAYVGWFTDVFVYLGVCGFGYQYISLFVCRCVRLPVYVCLRLEVVWVTSICTCLCICGLGYQYICIYLCICGLGYQSICVFVCRWVELPVYMCVCV